MLPEGKRVARDFNKSAAAYDMWADVQRQANMSLFSLLQAHGTWKEYGAILDAGCGTGYFHELLRKYRFRHALTQLDIAYRMCALAASYRSLPEFGITTTVNADMEWLPFATGSFSHVASCLALQWVPRPDVAITEMFRVLSSKGGIALATFGEGTLSQLATVFREAGKTPPVHGFMQGEMLQALLAQAGFRKITIYQEKKVLYYPSLSHILQTLKGLGASYKGKKGSYYGKHFFPYLEAIYTKIFGEAAGLPVQWNILYTTASKE